MFIKPYRVKSSVQLKSSEKKKFRQLVEQCYPSTAVNEVLSNKSNVTLSRVVPHQEAVLGMIEVHSIEKTPIFLTMDRDSVPIPTVHTLWQLPDMLPKVTMPVEVLQKLLGGADLMLPGIFPESLPDNWSAGEVVSVCTKNNGAALAVGIWATDKSQAVANNMKGRGIHIYQVYQDELWASGSREKLPTLPPPTFISDNLAPDDSTPDHDNPTLDGSDITEQIEDLRIQSGSQPMEELLHEEQEPEGPNMDELILAACYRALKTSLAKDELPILISTFYAKHVKPSSSIPIEIKQSSYKKVGTLIKALQSDGILTMKEQKKGVLTICEVQLSHPSLKGMTKLETDEVEEEEEDIAVVGAFVCNAAMLPLFSKYGHRKGDILTKQEVRRYVTEYIKTNDLTNKDKRSLVNLDPLLSTLIKTRALTSTWNTIMQKISSNCGQCYIVSLPDKIPIIVKGELPPISFKVEKRSGNKKMTIISRFEVFGIEPKELSHRLQLAMSSSASVVLGIRDQYEVQVQGDARKIATKILLEQYKIPRNFVQKF